MPAVCLEIRGSLILRPMPGPKLTRPKHRRLGPLLTLLGWLTTPTTMFSYWRIRVRAATLEVPGQLILFRPGYFAIREEARMPVLLPQLRTLPQGVSTATPRVGPKIPPLPVPAASSTFPGQKRAHHLIQLTLRGCISM